MTTVCTETHVVVSWALVGRLKHGLLTLQVHQIRGLLRGGNIELGRTVSTMRGGRGSELLWSVHGSVHVPRALDLVVLGLTASGKHARVGRIATAIDEKALVVDMHRVIVHHRWVFERNSSRALDDHGARSAVTVAGEHRLDVKTAVGGSIRGDVVCKGSNVVSSVLHETTHVLVVVAHHTVGGVILIAEVVSCIITTIVLVDRSADSLDFTAEDHLEGFTTDRFFYARETRSVPPLVELSSKSIGLHLEQTEFTRGKGTVTTRGLDVSNGRVDDGGLGRTTDLGEVGQQGSQILLWHAYKRLFNERKTKGHTKKRPFRVSLRCLSTAL